MHERAPHARPRLPAGILVVGDRPANVASLREILRPSGHAGEISVESRPGTGSTFRVALPPAQTGLAALPAAEPMRERGAPMIDDAPLFLRAMPHRIELDHDAAAQREAREVIEVLQASRSAD